MINKHHGIIIKKRHDQEDMIEKHHDQEDQKAS